MNKRARFRKSSFFVCAIVILFTTVVVWVIHHNHDVSLSIINNQETSNEKIDQQITEIMGHMTIKDKIRQMFIIEMRSWLTEKNASDLTSEDYGTSTVELVDFTQLPSDIPGIQDNYSSETTPESFSKEATPDAISSSPRDFFSTYHYGGIIMYDENIASIEQITTLNSDLQKINAETGGLPLFIAIDQEGGYINRLPGTLFPGNMAIAATENPEIAKIVGWIIGDELALTGFNVDFAPDADINTNPSNPIIGVRSFGDNPAIVAEFSTAFAEGLKNANIISCAKHFPGHGDTAIDSHFDLPVVDSSLEDLKATELVPFQSLIEHDIDMIMTAHILLPQIENNSDDAAKTLPATLSDDVITGLLRNELHYDGVVVTDGIQMAAIQDNFTTAEIAKYAINAGVDILLAPYNITSPELVQIQEGLVSDIASMVDAGEISISRIDESVRRILGLKIKKGLMEHDYLGSNLNHQLLKARLGVRAAGHLVVESDIADDAVTVYRGGDLLPLDKNLKILSVPANSEQNELLVNAFARAGIDMKVMLSDSSVSLIADELDQDTDLLMLTSYYMGIDNTAEVEKNHKLIAIARQKNIPSVVISTGLPYDVIDYADADIVLAVYNPAVGFAGGPYPENIPAAFRVLFGMSTSTNAGHGSLPVRLTR